MIKIPFLVTPLALSLIFSACSQEIKNEPKETDKKEVEATTEDESPYSKAHEYGGWYCPDNFGFEPVDITKLDQVPVVSGRMPQKWEAQSGLSLMYLDPVKFPQAKALDIELPALAYVDHPYADMKELAVIIQAFVADEDTIVGYRFPNGGNGSAWYGQVDFLSDEEITGLEPAPFVYEEFTIKATKKEVWKAFTKSDFAKDLANQFKEKKMTKSDWYDGLDINLKYSKENDMGTGYVANVWGNLYMHIDYIIDGHHSSYKFMVSEDAESGECTISFVAGPYPDSIEEETAKWQEWADKLKDDAGC